MKIETRPLAGTALAKAWLQGRPEARALFSRHPADLESYRSKAEEVDARVAQDERVLAASCLIGGGEHAKERLAAFVEKRGFVVTTGQQPGLFGGPLYGLYKGLTAAALARRLESALGRPVLPVFWIASEDHDWDEARSTHLIDVENELHQISLPPADWGDRPLYRIPAGPKVTDALTRLVALMPETEFLPRWRDLLERAYAPERTLPEAYEDVLDALLGPAGVFLVQSHQPDLKMRALPLLLSELAQSDAREAALAENGASIEAAGFDLQVPLIEGATNVFVQKEERRERIFRDDGSFRLRGSEEKFSFDEIETLATRTPSSLSPNVLLRPVVESYLFPTLSYVAGPGETSYLPQTAPVFAGHGMEMPVVHPRMSLTVIERKVEKVLKKFDLDIEAMDAPHERLAGRIAREQIPEDIQSALDGLRRTLGEGTDRLAASVSGLDPTLSGPVKSFRNSTFGLLSDVEKKVVQSLKRENDVALSQIAKAQLHLFPNGQPQERVFNPFYYLVRYDRAFLDELAAQAEAAVLPQE